MENININSEPQIITENGDIEFTFLERNLIDSHKKLNIFKIRNTSAREFINNIFSVDIIPPKTKKTKYTNLQHTTRTKKATNNRIKHHI